MAIFNYLHITIHDCKTNLSRYLRMLERGECRAIIVQRHATPVAMLVPMQRLQERADEKLRETALAEETGEVK